MPRNGVRSGIEAIPVPVLKLDRRKRVVEANSLAVTACNEAGAVFTVTLPHARDAEAVAGRDEAGAPTPREAARP